MIFLRFLLTAVILLLGVAGSAGAATWRVTADGTGDAPTIQAAIDSAASSDTLLIEAGSYLVDLTIADKSLTLIGTEGAESTVLDGALTARILTVLRSEVVRLEGLTFRRGRAGGLELNSTGGAVAAFGSSLIVESCVFRGNVSTDAGGAIFISSFGAEALSGQEQFTTLSLNRSTFENNFGGGDGGGVFLDEVPSFVSGCTFLANNAVLGGGVAMLGQSHTVIDCVFRENDALSGGGLHLTGAGSATIQDTRFEANRAEDFGGGLYVASGNVIALSRCWFLSNRALRGAGGYLRLTAMIAERVLWYGGLATDRGGGLFLDRTDNTSITRCTWLDNSAGRGASLTSTQASLTIRECVSGDESVFAFDCGSGSTVTASCNAGGTVTAGCFRFQARTTIEACLQTPEALCTIPVVPGCGSVGHADVTCPPGTCSTPALPATWGRLKARFPR